MPTRHATQTRSGQIVATALQPAPTDGLFSLPPAPPPPVNPKPLFDPGRVVATPAALALLDSLPPVDGEDRVIHLLNRHLQGDWGHLDDHDKRQNDQALKTGERLLSAYKCDGSRVWIITEWDRSATTILLPEEY